jgi:hypothetical protein
LFEVNNGLILSPDTYETLNGFITQNTQASERLFLRAVAVAAARGHIKGPFADLVTFNASVLLSKL